MPWKATRQHQTQHPCSFPIPSSQREAAPTSLPGQENPPLRVGLLSRFFWILTWMAALKAKKSNMMSTYSVVLHDATPVMLGWSLSAQVGKSHMLRQNWGQEFRTLPTSHVILSPQPCSHPTAPSCSPLKLLSSGQRAVSLRWQLLLVICTEDRPGCSVSSACCGRRPGP